MARRFGRINQYNSRLRRCAICWSRGYEKEMRYYQGRYYCNNPGCWDKDKETRPSRLRLR
jgi:hypothetical protein